MQSKGGDSGLHVEDVRDDGRAYVLDRKTGLYEYDVEVPLNPVETARTATPDVAVSIAASDGLVYLTDRAGGLCVLWP